METGTTSFLDRIALTKRLDENLTPFLVDHGFKVLEYGHPVILRDNGSMRTRVLRRKYKKSLPVLMVKFSPDFLVVHSASGTEPFMMDSKVSITPVFFGAHIQRIRDESGIADLDREDIFVIEREAWDVYNRYYPKDRVSIILACPYHPRLLLADWVSQVTPLYRFELDHNPDAGGSGTPHVNLHMGLMRTLAEFLKEEFDEVVDPENYEILRDFIKLWPLNKTKGIVNWTQFNNVVVDLQPNCPWLKTRNEPPGWRPRQPRLL